MMAHRNDVICLVIWLFLFIVTAGCLKETRKVLTLGNEPLPLVVNTWAFTDATAKAWEGIYNHSKTALDTVEIGCTQCEIDQCDGTVGFGGSPDENGETTLDAMIMDGKTMNIGAVGSLRRVKSAISVARRVLENTDHTLLVGSQATEFAKSMGFQEEDIFTPESHAKWRLWMHDECQPNFWENVSPNPKQSCGPYRRNPNPIETNEVGDNSAFFSSKNHDTIGMIAIDKDGNIAAGTSTNGASHKIPGRVGDSPIPGAGAYADNEVGAAVATGDGDIMMRFLPSFLAIEHMRKGFIPEIAAKYAMQRIAKFYPTFKGAIVVVDKDGHFAAACNGFKVFPYAGASPSIGKVKVMQVTCIDQF